LLVATFTDKLFALKVNSPGDIVTQINPDTFNRLAEAQLPMALQFGFHAESIGDGTATVRMPYTDALLRPGGTISGPALMGLSDFAMYPR